MMEELDLLWNNFLNILDDENAFERGLKRYLQSIKYISEIREENIDNDAVRKTIDENISNIVDFIDNYKNQYYEISKIEGFKTNKDNKIQGRDYYFYIADQKMKASVYYARYLHFLSTSDAKEELKEIIDINKASKKETIIYLMFNNMMREIYYWGAAYRFLWHWESQKTNLFRYAFRDGNEAEIKATSKKDFLEKMFQDVIACMNGNNLDLLCYSKDPFIDIYKYLKLSANKNSIFTDIDTNNTDIQIQINNLENPNVAKFEVLNGVDINKIRRNGKNLDFYDFVQEEDITDGEQISYAVELYADLPDAEKNENDSVIKIKDKLGSYFSTWGDMKKVVFFVADDKEVVMSGEMTEKTLSVNEVFGEQLSDNTKYIMELTQNEIIYLLLQIGIIHRKKEIEQLVENFKFTLSAYSKTPVRDSLSRILVNGVIENVEMKGFVLFKVTDKEKAVSIDLHGKFSDKYVLAISQKDGRKLTIDDCEKALVKKMNECMKAFFINRYKSILECGRAGQYKNADFILNYIKEKEYKCPDYIRKYNEYFPKNISHADFDIELSILKELIFKR